MVGPLFLLSPAAFRCLHMGAWKPSPARTEQACKPASPGAGQPHRSPPVVPCLEASLVPSLFFHPVKGFVWSALEMTIRRSLSPSPSFIQSSFFECFVSDRCRKIRSQLGLPSSSQELREIVGIQDSLDPSGEA